MILKAYHSGVLAVNCYLMADEETKMGFIVDPGGVNTNLLEYVEEMGLDIQYIILTHGHGDHTGGVAVHQKAFPDAKLVASRLEEEFLKDPALNLSGETNGKGISLTADIYVNDGDILTAGNLELKFISTPGHTPGGMCILVENILFSGDTLFCQSIGRTDFPLGSFADLKKSIHEKLFVLPDDVQVLPGHMEPTTIGMEKRSNPFV